MFLKHLDLTTALRPSYLPDEDLLFVQDNVGLYEGKYKLLNQQNGQVYLTSHRICYVDKADPRKYSAALDLKEVDRYEFYAGFLKSSAKITLVPKLNKRSSIQTRTTASGSPANGSTDRSYRASPLSGGERNPTPAAAATWVCTICSFSNPVPSNFDPESLNAQTPLPPCLACGIQPTLTHVLKAVIASASNRPSLGSQTVPATEQHSNRSTGDTDVLAPAPTKPTSSDPSFPCPRCTFLNYPSLLSCEMCGAALVSADLPAELTQPQLFREESPGPVVAASFSVQSGADSPQSVKLSFRGGGEKIFYERLKGAIAQRKWLLHNAPPVPSRSQAGTDASLSSASLAAGGSRGERQRTVKTAGIAGLERRGVDMRKNTELVIGSAFEDLEALMASAKQVVALAERLAQQTGTASGSSDAANNNMVLAESASQLGLVTTKDIVGGGGSSGRESLYLSELARNLAEFLTDDARGVLRRAGGILTLVDLWAMFNRARGGVELVSPLDLLKAAQLWEKLRLPVRLRTFKSGVMVVQSRDRTDEATVKAIIGWLRDLRAVPPEQEAPWYWQEFGRGVSAQEVAQQFGWSIGVAEEELEMAEERGMLCREEGISGLLFWENFIDTGEYRKRRRKVDPVYQALKEIGLL